MKRWEVIKEITKVLLEPIREREKIEKITENLQQFLMVTRCVILETREDGTEYEITTAKPSSVTEHGIGEIGFVAGKTAIEEVLKIKNVLLVSDAKNNPLTHYMSHWAVVKDIHAVLFVPIVINQEVEAIMVYDATGERVNFTEEEVEFALGCAGFIEELFIKEKESYRRQQQEQIGFSVKFCSDLEHVVRNPLVSIGGYARRTIRLIEQAQKKELSFEEQQVVSSKAVGSMIIIQEEVGKIELVFKDLIGLAKIEQQIKPIDIDINTLIFKALEELRSEGSPIHCRLNLEALSILKLDTEKISLALKYILANLFEEAIRQQDPAQQEIQISSRVREAKVEVIFANHGQLKPEVMEYFFKPFININTVGSGLGLPIAKKLIELNKGDFSIKEEKNKIICKITFPLEKNQEQPT